jgi:hypothetical protein
MSTTPTTVTCTPDAYIYQFGDLQIVLDRFVEDKRDGLRAEIEITSSREPRPGLIHYGRIALASTASRRQIVQACEARTGDGWHDDTDFGGILEYVCVHAIKRWREGEPTTNLLDVAPTGRPRWLLRPFLEHGGPTVVFAYGESGKSLLALAMAVSLAAGAPLVGEPQGEPCPVLYLDWESDQHAHAERLRALLAGAGLTLAQPIYYRRMLASLPESVATARKEIAVRGVGAVVIDSLGMARGGDANEMVATVDVFRAIRSLGVPALVLDHLAKEATGDHPFGSIYTTNLARLTWRLDSAKEEKRQEYHVAFVHKKGNNVGRLPRLAYRVTFATESESEILRTVTIDRCDPLAVPAFEQTASLRERILHVIDTEGPQTAAQLIARLELDERQQQQVYSRLADLRRAGVLAQDADGRHARLYQG